MRAGVKGVHEHVWGSETTQVLSFHISVASNDWTKVIRVVRQAPLPAQPFYQRYLQFLQEMKKQSHLSLINKGSPYFILLRKPNKAQPPPTWFQSQNHLEFSFPKE